LRPCIPAKSPQIRHATLIFEEAIAVSSEHGTNITADAGRSISLSGADLNGLVEQHFEVRSFTTKLIMVSRSGV